MNILVVYGTTEGQTRKISEWVGTRIQKAGHAVALRDSTTLSADFDVVPYDAVVVAASVHQGQYQSSLIHFVKDHLERLHDRPTVFLSVSMASVLDEGKDDAQSYVDRFLSETGWRPTQTELVSGALLYTQYDFFKRQMMKLIVWKGGGPTDANQDYEFTDWGALARIVDSFLKEAAS